MTSPPGDGPERSHSGGGDGNHSGIGLTPARLAGKRVAGPDAFRFGNHSNNLRSHQPNGTSAGLRFAEASIGRRRGIPNKSRNYLGLLPANRYDVRVNINRNTDTNI